MGQILQAFPSLPSHVQTVTLGEMQYTVRFRWNERTASWYFDLRTIDDTPVILGRRLSPDWMPLLGLTLDNEPSGHMFVRGPDGYGRDDLGGDLLLIRYDLDDIPDAPADPYAPTVVISP